MLLFFTQAKLNEDEECKELGRLALDHTVIKGFYTPVDRFDVVSSKCIILLCDGGQSMAVIGKFDEIKDKIEESKLS